MTTWAGLRLALTAIAAILAGCAAGPPVPDWKTNAASALDEAVAAYLRGDTRVADAGFTRARREVARTGRADLLARVELTRCAAQVASVVFEECEGFAKLRADAPPAERAYADYLAGRVVREQIELLPPQHRRAALAGADAGPALRAIDDPLARLVAVGVAFRTAHAGAPDIALAVDTASAQGWRRPLLAWLNVELALAEKAGDAAQAERLRRRIEWVGGQG